MKKKSLLRVLSLGALFALGCGESPPPTFSQPAILVSTPQATAVRLEDYWVPMRDSEDRQVSEKVLGKCLAGEDVRSQFPSQFAILEITPTELRFAGEPVLRLEDFEVADEGQLRGQLISPLFKKADSMAEIHKRAGEAAPCWPPFEGRVLIALDPDAPFAILRMAMYSLGQAQFGEFSFWVNSPEVTIAAEANPPTAAWAPPVFEPEPIAEPEANPEPPAPKKALSPEEQAKRDEVQKTVDEMLGQLNQNKSLCCMHPIGGFSPSPCRATLTRVALESGFSLSYTPALGPEQGEVKQQNFLSAPGKKQEVAVQEWLASLAVDPDIGIDWIDIPAPASTSRQVLQGGAFVLELFPRAQWVIAGGIHAEPLPLGQAPTTKPASQSPESKEISPTDWIAVLPNTMPAIGMGDCIGTDGQAYRRFDWDNSSSLESREKRAPSHSF